ncbi:MAG: TldD/PmbA family protein [Candidatus Woesearchaeota archaeon]
MQKYEIGEIKAFFADLIQELEKYAVYADALLIKNDEKRISKDKTSLDIATEADFGVKVRMFDGASFNEIGISGFDKEEIRKKSLNVAKKIIKKNKFQLNIDTKCLDKDFFAKPEINPETISLPQKTAAVNMAYNEFLKISKEFVNVRIVYIETREEKIFVNRFKQLYQNIPGVLLIMMPIVQTKEGEIRYHYEGTFTNGFETMKKAVQKIPSTAEMALRIKDAKKIDPGKYTVICSPSVSGLLAHESFGHGMESDTIWENRAKAKEFLGKKIAPEYVNIIENPALPGKHGSYFFDDEGQIAEPVYLVKNGIVNQPITELYSISRLGLKKSANGRCESYDHKIFARMSNTYFAAEKTSVNEMIKKVKNGYYLHQGGGGMEDPKGWGVQIQGVLAEKIKDGKLTNELFYEASITGFLPDILNNIKAVGNKLEVEGTGQCGKGHKEWIRVSEGGAHLLIEGVLLT